MYASGDETLIERLKRYYADYRLSEDPDASFRDACAALSLSVIDTVGELADREDCAAIRNVLREYREIRVSTQGSNDSVKERLESELRERAGQPV